MLLRAIVALLLHLNVFMLFFAVMSRVVVGSILIYKRKDDCEKIERSIELTFVNA